TAAVLSRARGREDRACALDVAVCGALVLLMTVPLVLGAAPGAGQHAGHAHGDHRLVLAAQVVVLLGAWAVSRRRLVPGPSLTRVARAAPWAMALGMGAMIVA
ncbi:MAG: hypothetical protein HOQ22_03410, partial [Nocardioidaceae bacterium]|nr:hypothetical protein [Nocardioidaceae bacterium]